MSDLLRPASEMPADDMAIAEARTRRRGELLSELAQAINSTSTENASNTPDFILANFAAACLDAFAEASVAREAWYGKSLSIDGETSDIAALEARMPAPATDVDALLAEVEAMLSRMATRGDDKAFNVIQRLATALRESRAGEVAEPYRHALEQRLICSNLPLLTGDADTDLMRFVFHEQELAGYFCGQLEKDLAAERVARVAAHAFLEGMNRDDIEPINLLHQAPATAASIGRTIYKERTALDARLTTVSRERDAAIARAEKAESEAKEANSTLDMYAKAWWRELKGPYRNKRHEIDALVLTTRERISERDAAIARAEKAEAELVNTQGLLSLSREEHDASILENALLESQIIVLREAEKDHLASAASEQESMYTLRENYDSVLKRAIRAEGRATRAENENVSLVEKLATKEGVIQNWMNLHDEAIERADALATDLAAARAELGGVGEVEYIREAGRSFGARNFIETVSDDPRCVAIRRVLKGGAQ